MIAGASGHAGSALFRCICGYRRGDPYRRLRHVVVACCWPNSLVIRSGQPWHGPPYGLVKLSPDVVKVLDEYGPRSLSALFGDHRPPPEVKLGIGDIVSITVFEAAAGGLFIPAEAGVRPGNFVA